MPLSNGADLPTGTATFLFTDIQGSTKLAQQLGDQRWRELLEKHYAVLRAAFARHNGYEVKTEGDAFFVAFGSAVDAVAATTQGQRDIEAADWPEDAAIRVRMGLHTGDAMMVDGDYMGLEIHRAARVAATGHGGQVVLSDPTRVLVEGALPQGVSVVDLGEHQLKDLARPEHLYQLKIDGLQAEFPPLKSLDLIPNNLPTQLTSFVGRDRELVEVGEQLERNRLVTLTGPGGMGKTRLSIQAAAEASDGFKDGAYFVPLAPVTDPDLVASAIADSLKLVEKTARPPLDTIREYLQERKMLLVLDNFEQVISAAGIVADILKSAPGVKVIATSRAPLRVYGEQEYPVPPLALPDPSIASSLEAVSHFEAVRLFIERAVAVKPDFRITNENAPAVAAICALVDGLPLAIELAAARIKLMPPEAMLKRLETSLGDLGGGARDLPERQQTLRGAIAWSHDLLDVGVQRLMARLSVFVRGAQLDDIERVCGPDQGADVLDGLETLVQQNLLRSDDTSAEPRFLMLHVIREYAIDQLAESGEEGDIRRRHAELFLELAEAYAPKVTSKEQGAALDRLDREHDNLRAAIGWFESQGEHVPALRVVTALWRFWTMRGHVLEGVERIDHALEAIEAEQSPLECMAALEAAGGLAWWVGKNEVCIARYDAALALARQSHDDLAVARNLYNLTFPWLFKKDTFRARELVDEAIAKFQALGNELGEARAVWIKGSVDLQEENFDEALELNQAAMDAFRRLGTPFDLTWALHEEALICIRIAKLEEGRVALLEGAALITSAGDVSGLSIFLDDFADLSQAEGDKDRAMRLKGASQALQDRTGSRQQGRVIDRYAERAQAELEADVRFEELLEEGKRLSAEEALEYAKGGRLPSELAPSGTA